MMPFHPDCMEQGRVESIQVGPEAKRPLVAVRSVRAVRGLGLEGDRYFRQAGTFSKHPGIDRDVTLIEAEALEALERETGIALDPADSRRNVVTRGIRLNDLVGHVFRIGDVLLKGTRLCDPCRHLERLTKKGVLDGLVHRGGLRTVIVKSGTIHVSDAIRRVQEGLFANAR
jgi:MOSC domain-containing protein YiiM